MCRKPSVATSRKWVAFTACTTRNAPVPPSIRKSAVCAVGSMAAMPNASGDAFSAVNCPLS